MDFNLPSGTTSKVGKGKFVKIDVVATVFPEGYDANNPFAQQPSYCENKSVLLWSRRKYLSFHEDYRPPYNGTWSKRSSRITGRRPFGKDVGPRGLNYDVDSEGEWEEDDEQGEELGSDAGEDDELEEADKVDKYNYGDGWLREDDDLGNGSDGEQDAGDRALRRKEGSGDDDAGGAIVGARGLQRVIIGCLLGGIPLDGKFVTEQCGEEGGKMFQRVGVCGTGRATKVELYMSALPPPNMVEDDDEEDCEDGGKAKRSQPGRVHIEAVEVARLLVQHVHNNNTPAKDKLVEDFLKLEEFSPAQLGTWFDSLGEKATLPPSKSRLGEKIAAIARKCRLQGGGFVWRVNADALKAFLGASYVDVVPLLAIDDVDDGAAAAAREADEERRKRVYPAFDTKSFLASLKNKKLKVDAPSSEQPSGEGGK